MDLTRTRNLRSFAFLARQRRGAGRPGRPARGRPAADSRVAVGAGPHQPSSAVRGLIELGVPTAPGRRVVRRERGAAADEARGGGRTGTRGWLYRLAHRLGDSKAVRRGPGVGPPGEGGLTRYTSTWSMAWTAHSPRLKRASASVSSEYSSDSASPGPLERARRRTYRRLARFFTFSSPAGM